MQGAQALQVRLAAAAGRRAGQRGHRDAIWPRAAAAQAGLRLPRARRRRARRWPAPPARVEALYQAPYLAHVTMEPMNCTAQVARRPRRGLGADPGARAWRAPIAARVAGVAEAAVTVHVSYLGGGFGRRLDVDVVGQAVRVAMETGGRPVQLLWPRDEDIGHDFYRPGRRGLAARRLRRRRRADGAGHHAAPATPSRRAGWSARCRPWPGRSTCPTRPPPRACSTCPTTCRTSASRTRHAQRRAGGLLALGRAFAQRLLQRRLHRRAGARGRRRPGGVPAGAAGGLPRHAAVLRAGRRARRLGQPAAGRPRARRGAARELRQHRGPGGRGLAGRRPAPRAPRRRARSTAAPWSTPASSRSRWSRA